MSLRSSSSSQVYSVHIPDSGTLDFGLTDVLYEYSKIPGLTKGCFSDLNWNSDCPSSIRTFRNSFIRHVTGFSSFLTTPSLYLSSVPFWPSFSRPRNRSRGESSDLDTQIYCCMEGQKDGFTTEKVLVGPGDTGDGTCVFFRFEVTVSLSHRTVSSSLFFFVDLQLSSSRSLSTSPQVDPYQLEVPF